MRRNYPEYAVIFIASLFSCREIFEAAIPRLRDVFGRAFYQSPLLPWDYSSYYNAELGAPLLRSFIFFEPIVDSGSLVEAKLSAVEIEKSFTVDGKRRINLDPGYMSLAKVVLASRKNYSHRIYLGKGVFCELELFYQKGRFNPLPYTYYDYRNDMFLRFFTDARDLLKKRLDKKKSPADKSLVIEGVPAGNEEVRG